MRADNSHHVIATARRRAAATHKRAVAALRRMDTAGSQITFDALAREARVSRSWLYKQTDIRAEVERLRARQDANSPSRPVPDRQRASDPSLRQRLELATTRICQLETDNKQLREALAQALGERRAAEILGSRHDTPKRRISPIIDPC
jgi:small-conductance mechanosensitive channel